jgi:hypothetical protein
MLNVFNVPRLALNPAWSEEVEALARDTAGLATTLICSSMRLDFKRRYLAWAVNR